MDNNMSTAFAHRGSSGSASTSSSGTGTGTGSGGRVAVVGVTRSVRLRKRGNSGFGFSLRGGREHAAGFYVSEVQPGGEAHRNGLRVGDQIIRVNGYPVEDAVHQEVALLAKTQQVLVLKIRSVGMIPVKDNPNDPVTWHMVQQQCENASNLVPLHTEIRLRVHVGSKGRLGCSVCRGPTPGLTVQSTREGGAARVAGLRPGDVIVKCNGHRLTELPFDKAVEVMRACGILDLVVSRPTYYTPDPEAIFRGSTGYDSGNSSLLETSPLPLSMQGLLPPPSQVPQQSGRHAYAQNQGPCIRSQGRPRTASREVQWADIDGKGTCCPLVSSTDSCSSSGSWRHVDQMVEWTRKPNNTTVIRVNQHPGDHPGGRPSRGCRQGEEDDNEEPLYDPVAIPRANYETYYFDADNDLDQGRRQDSTDGGVCSPLYDPVAVGYRDPKEDHREGNRLAEMQFIQKQTETERKTITTVEVHHAICPPPPPSMPMNGSYPKPMSAVGVQMGSTMSMGSTGSTETESSLELSCGKDSASTSSSSSTCEPASSSSYATIATRKVVEDQETSGTISTTPVAPPLPSANANANANVDLSSAIAQELQRRAQKARARENSKSVQESRKQRFAEPAKMSPADEQKVTHDKLMEEFKRAHQRMFNNCKRNLETNGKSTESQPTPAATSSPAVDTSENQERRNAGVARRQNPGGAPPPPPPPRGVTAPKSRMASDDAVEMQSIESFKLKESQQNVSVPKPPPTYFPPARDDTVRDSDQDGTSRGTASPPSVIGSKVPAPSAQGVVTNSVTPSTGPANTVVGRGKVAIRIGAYSGEAKAPAKLDFLGPQPPPPPPPVAPTPLPGAPKSLDAKDSAPVASRLQNELAATLQRSNLRKKTEGENVAKSTTNSATSSPTKSANNDNNQTTTVATQSNVEKLAAVLGNKVTIRINNENVVAARHD